MANERNDQAHDQEFVDAIKKPARYNFGNGLFLDVKKSGKYWVFAYNGTAVGEGPRERIGLGTAKNMRLKDAQREALLLDQVLENDSSPKVHWAQRKSTGLGGPVTFAQAAEQYYEVARDEVWKADGSWMLMRGIKNNYLLKADCAKLPLQAVNHLHIEAILKQRVHPYFDARGRRRHFEPERLIALDKEQPGLSNTEAAKILKSERHTVSQYRKLISSGAATPRLRLPEGVREKLDDDLMGPLWTVKSEIAKRARIFLMGMFEHFRSKMQFTGSNPADIRKGMPLARLLPEQAPGSHHQALRVDEMPPLLAFIRKPQRDPDLVTTAQLAQALGKDPIAIRAMRRKKILTPHKEPGRLRKTPSYVYSLKQVKAEGLKIVNPITLRSDEFLYVRIMEMLILTLARSDMICKLKWSEIQPKYEGSVQGMIIYEKHKTSRFGYTYGTVITPQIQRILDEMAARRERDGITGPYVFAHGPTEHGLDRYINRPTGAYPIEACLRRCLAQIDAIETKDATMHGMRTTFGTWATDLHDYDHDMAMVTIGHRLDRPDADRIYLRNWKKLQQRHAMGTEWGKYCFSQCKLPELPQQDNELTKLPQQDNKIVNLR